MPDNKKKSIQKDKNITGPISFINSYYNSDEFRRKAGPNADKLLKEISENASSYNPLVLEEDPRNIGSAAAPIPISGMLGLESGHNIIISKPQAARTPADPIQDVLPHEYTHTTRNNLTNEESAKFTSANKNKKADKLMREFRSIGNPDFEFMSEWSQAMNPYDHDLFPHENYADLNSLRYMMYKQGIYDARKRKMTKEDLNKAKKDPWLKDQFGLKRLLNTFSDEDLIKLNNEVALSDNNNNNSTMANDGIKLEDGGPGDEVKKKSSSDIKKKYTNNPYITGGREQWGEYLDTKSLPFSGHTVKQAIYNAANTTKLNPQLLYASAMEEGLREGIDQPDAVSEAYLEAIGEKANPKGQKKQSFDPNQFPIDGFRTYGLDTFGDQYENLQKKGYLPKDFDKRFTKFKAVNEIEEKKQKAGKEFNYVNSAAFKTEDDALIAKAAMLRNTRDNLNNYTKKINTPLTDKQRDFFTLVGYNAGEGNMQKMIKSYKDKGYLKDDKFLDDTSFKPSSYGQPYTYAQRRLQNMQVMNNEGYFQDYTPPDQEQRNDGGPIDPKKSSVKLPSQDYSGFDPLSYRDIPLLDTAFDIQELIKSKNPAEVYASLFGIMAPGLASSRVKDVINRSEFKPAFDVLNLSQHQREVLTQKYGMGYLNKWKKEGMPNIFADGGPVLPDTVKAPTNKSIQPFNPYAIYSQQQKTSMSPAEQFQNIEDIAYEKFYSTPQKIYSDVGEKTPALTQGKLRGATPNKELLQDLVSAADKAGVPRDQMLALAANESMFGKGYRSGRYGRVQGNAPGISQQNVISSWDLANQYMPVQAAKFAYNKGVPFTRLSKSPRGYTFDVSDPGRYKQSLDSALAKHPEWIEQFKQANERVIPQGDINYFDLTAQALRDKGLKSAAFNPGDPDYANKIEAARKLVSSDPVLQPYLNKNDGGYLTFNPEIYDDLYPDGENTNLMMEQDFNDGGSIYTQKSNGFNPIAPQREDPWTPYMETAHFGYGDQFYHDGNKIEAKSGIHIKPENRGKFTAWAKSHSMGVQEAARHVMANKEKYSSTIVKRANFAKNAAGWKHNDGGIIDFNPETEFDIPEDTPEARSGIHINPKNKGKFTATKKRTGKTTEELTHSKNPLTRKRAIFAQNARKWHHGNDGINLPYKPNAVSTPENPMFYQDPLQEAKNNISNYFNNPQNNQIINDASMDYNPDLQNSYQDQGFSSTEADQSTLDSANRPSTGQRIGQFVGSMLSGVSLSTAPLIQGTAALANYATRGQQQSQEYARRVRKATQQDVYNPIKYGTGSQAIMNDGGSVKTLSDNQFSSPIMEFMGPSHEDGGIPINYAGTNVEVEGGETVFMDDGGDLNVFGNMTVPGTNKKFKSISKNLANIENRTQKSLDNSVNLVNQNDPDIKYQRFKFNAGKVMMGANREKLEELNQIKNELSDMQNMMLQNGFDEQSSKKLKMGGKIKKYAEGGEMFFETGRGKKTTTSRTPRPVTELMKGPGRPIQEPNIQVNPPRLTTIQEFDYNPPIVETNTEDNGTPGTRTTPNYSRRRSSLPVGQMLPELLTLATERPEFVPGQTYQPDLYTPYQVTFQDRLNENNSTFRAMQIQNANNPALVSQLAGQKYEADSRVLADEFRTNQGIQNDITNKNIGLLNQAKLTNLQLADQQMVRQSQARSNTRENIRNAINSISAKANQARLEDQTLAVYENMFPHFTFDNTGKLKFQDVDRPVFTVNNQGNVGNVLADNQRSRTKYDKQGNVKETTVTTPSRRDQEKLDLQLNKARTQRLGLFNSIFGNKRRGS